MRETVTCPNCRRKLVLPEEAAAEVRCPGCRTDFRPEAAFTPTPQAPPADPGGPAAWRPGPVQVPERPVALARRSMSRRAGCVIASLVAGIGVMAVAVPVVFFCILLSRQMVPSRKAARVYAGPVMIHWGNHPQKPPDPREEELAKSLGGLRKALESEDGDDIANCLDLDRMLDELVVRHALPAAATRDRPAILRALRDNVGKEMSWRAAELAWITLEVRKLEETGPNELVVFTRQWDQRGDITGRRWWLSRRSGAWRVYDFDNLNYGLRAATDMGKLPGSAFARVRERAVAAGAIRDAWKVYSREGADAAERRLPPGGAGRLSPDGEAARLRLVSEFHLDRGCPADALDCLVRARRLDPGLTVLELLEGVALNRLGRWADALRCIDAYRDLMSEDLGVCLQRGVALRGLGRFPEAAASYRAALGHDRTNRDSLLGLLRSLAPGDERDDIPERFTRLGSLRENFPPLARALAEDRDPVGLKQISRAMLAADPGCEEARLYLALAKVWAGQTDEAVRLFRASPAQVVNGQPRREVLGQFLTAMAQADRAVDAYDATPDPREAFALLAAELRKNSRTDELTRLVKAHAARFPDDRLLPFYRGEALVREGRYAEAQKAFEAGMARPPGRAELESFRDGRVLARYHTAGALAAYRDVGPPEETFTQLANLLLSEGADAPLEELLAVHAKAFPRNPDVPRFRLRLTIRQGKIDEAVRQFQAILAKQPDEARRQQVVSEFLFAMQSAGKLLEGYRAAPDPGQAFSELAEGLEEDGDYADLRRLVEAHRAARPKDLWLCYYAGVLHRQAKEWDRAVAVLSEGWKRAPDDAARERFRPEYVVALYHTAGALRAYREVGPPETTFTQLAELLLTDRKGEELEALLEAHRPRSKDRVGFLLYCARSKALLGRTDEALELLGRACGGRPVEPRLRWQVRHLLRELAAAGKAVEAYRADPDHAAAFTDLAADLLAGKRSDELRRLLHEHARAHAQDAMYLYYRGEYALLKGNVAEADAALTAALAWARPAQQGMVREGLFRVRVRAGKAAATYAAFGGQWFELLRNVCVSEKDAPQLRALLDAHRKAHPDDPFLPAWDLEARWLERDCEGALKIIRAHGDGVLALPRFRRQRDDCLVRCLVRLNRADEAVREADAVVRGGRGNRVLLVLARAARDGAGGAIAALEQPGPGRLDVADCYADPDLGPLLRSEPFVRFRARSPEPKGGGADDR
jgi:tetratricopeptide (TPR) repeat protein